MKFSLEKPKDMYAATLLIFILNRVLGTAPFSLEKSPRQYKIKNSLVVFSVLKICSAGVFIILNLYKCFETGWRALSVNIMFKLILNLTYAGLSILLISFGCIFSKDVIRGFKLMHSVDEKLKKLGIWMNYKNVRKLINIHVVMIVLFIVAEFTAEVVHRIRKGTFTNTFFVMYIPQLLVLSVDLQYYHYFKSAYSRFQILNEYLEALEKEENIFKVTTNKQNGSFYRRKLSAGTLKATCNTSDPEFVLQMVFELHLELTDMCNLFNRAFTFQMLLKTAIAFVAILLSVFYLFVSSERSWTGIYIAILTYCVIELYILVYISEKVRHEANCTALLYHKIKHKCTDPDLMDAIDLYSILMYNNRLQFTVCKLFPLDYTLLYMMAGAVTTYLIFLIQFSTGTSLDQYSILNMSNISYENTNTSNKL